MKNDNYIAIQGWMVNELGLKGNELIVFALVYGFCQDGDNSFNGRLSYISESIGCEKANARLILMRLVEKGMLCKTDYEFGGVKMCKYSMGEIAMACIKQLRGVVETTTGCSRNNYGGIVETTTSYNTNDILIRLKEIIDRRYEKVFADWLDYKRSRKEPYANDKSIEAAYNKLVKLSKNSPQVARIIVDESMANNWAGLFAVTKQQEESNGVYILPV